MIDRSPFVLDFDDSFAGPELNPNLWIPHYLPHWTTPERSLARYDFDEQGLRLRIDQDQLSLRDEDPELRVSNIQTATFSGPVGSTIGSSHDAPGLRVRTEVPHVENWAPIAGLVEITMSANPDPTTMMAAWLIAVESTSPIDAGEITICELFGTQIGKDQSVVRLGIKAIADPRLKDDVEDITVPFDSSESHTYAASWNSERVEFYIDERLVKTAKQSLHYPLQLMIDLFEFPESDDRDPSRYPKTAHVHRARGYHLP